MMRITTTVSGLIATCSLGVMACSSPKPAPTHSLELTEYGLIADVEIGRENPHIYRMIFDTGAEMSVLNSAGELPEGLELVQEVNVAGNTAARTRSGVCRTGYLGVAGFDFDQALILAIDLSNRPGPFINGIDGILSPQIIASGYLEINFSTSAIQIHQTVDESWGEPTPFSEGSLPVAIIDVAGRAVTVTLDSGARDLLMLPAAMAEDLPLEARPLVSGGIATVTDEVEVSNGTLDGEMVIGGQVYSHPELNFASDIDQPLMGIRGLTSFRLIMDSAGKRSWLILADIH